MAEWVYPLGSAADGCWDVSLGTADSAITVDGWEHTGLKVASLAPGAAVELPATGEERIVIPLSGAFTVKPVPSPVPRSSAEPVPGKKFPY